MNADQSIIGSWAQTETVIGNWDWPLWVHSSHFDGQYPAGLPVTTENCSRDLPRRDKLLLRVVELPHLTVQLVLDDGERDHLVTHGKMLPGSRQKYNWSSYRNYQVTANTELQHHHHLNTGLAQDLSNTHTYTHIYIYRERVTHLFCNFSFS